MCASPLLRLGPARVCTGRGKACTYSDPLGSAYGCASLLLRLGPARVCTGRGRASTRTCSGPRRSVHVFSFDSGPLGSVRGGATLRHGPVWARVRGVQLLSFDSGPLGSVRGRATLRHGHARVRVGACTCSLSTRARYGLYGEEPCFDADLLGSACGGWKFSLFDSGPSGSVRGEGAFFFCLYY